VKIAPKDHGLNESPVAKVDIEGGQARSHLNHNHCNDEDHTAVLTLCDNGTIFECNEAAAELLDCPSSRLTWQHISTILPKLTEITLMQGGGINPNLRFLSRIGYSFEVVDMSGVHFVSAVFFNEIESLGRHFLRVILLPVVPGYAMA